MKSKKKKAIRRLKENREMNLMKKYINREINDFIRMWGDMYSSLSVTGECGWKDYSPEDLYDTLFYEDEKVDRETFLKIITEPVSMPSSYSDEYVGFRD